jgi:electron transfer flavoprotein beta subunit
MNMPIVTYAVKIREVNTGEHYAIIERKTETHNEVIKVGLPAALTCEKDIAEIPFASLPDLINSLRYEPEVWTSESPIVFDPAQIGLKGSPTAVFKTGTPEKHAGGEVIHTEEVGMESAIKMALDKLAITADGKAILGVMQ